MRLDWSRTSAENDDDTIRLTTLTPPLIMDNSSLSISSHWQWSNYGFELNS